MFKTLKFYFFGVFEAGRWRMFLRSRMWLSLPVAVVISFIVFFLLRRFSEGIPTAEVLWRGAVYALVIAFCWALGVWASIDRSLSHGQQRETETRSGRTSRPVWVRYIMAFGLLSIAFLLTYGTQIADIISGAETFAHGFTELLLKAMVVMAVVIPVWRTWERG